MARRFTVIANPIAGQAGASGRIEAIRKALEKDGNEVEVCLTGARGDGRRIAARTVRNSNENDRLCAVGGDGTLNEVICGMMDTGLRRQIAFFPAGTFNVTAHELNLPKTIDELAEVALGEHVRYFDLIETGTGRFSVLCAGVGLDGEIAHQVATNRTKKGITFLAYVKPIFRSIFGYRFPKLKINIDGKTMEPAPTFMVAGNMRRYGGPFALFRKASPEDGMLDLCCFDATNPWQLLRAGLYSLAGQLPNCPGIRYATGKEIKIDADDAENVRIQIDGDPAGTLPVTFRVIAGAAALCAPPVQAELN